MVFLVVALLAIFLTLITISYRAIKVAMAIPFKRIRSDWF